MKSMYYKNKKSKVAMVSYPKFASGVTQYSFYLFQAIENLKKNSSVFFVCNRHDNYDDICQSSNLVKIIEKTRLLPLSIFKFLLFLHLKNIKIVHFQSFFKYPILTYLLTRILKIARKKVFFTAHDILPHYQYPWDFFFTKKMYQSLDGVIVHSATNKQDFLNNFGDICQIKIIPHPIYNNYNSTKKVTKTEARRKIGVSNAAKILLFFGHIDKRKGVEVLLKGFPAILRKDKAFHLVLAGRDNFHAGYLEKLIYKLNIEHHVTIYNRFINDDEVPLFFTATDAVVLPYLRGTTSGVLKIAFAHKIPVIATKIGELPEAVKAYNAGVLVDLPLTDKDINAVISILRNRNSKQLYKNYNKLIDFFSWDNAAKKTIDFYGLS